MISLNTVCNWTQSLVQVAPKTQQGLSVGSQKTWSLVTPERLGIKGLTDRHVRHLCVAGAVTVSLFVFSLGVYFIFFRKKSAAVSPDTSKGNTTIMPNKNTGVPSPGVPAVGAEGLRERNIQGTNSQAETSSTSNPPASSVPTPPPIPTASSTSGNQRKSNGNSSKPTLPPRSRSMAQLFDDQIKVADSENQHESIGDDEDWETGNDDGGSIYSFPSTRNLIPPTAPVTPKTPVEQFKSSRSVREMSQQIEKGAGDVAEKVVFAQELKKKKDEKLVNETQYTDMMMQLLEKTAKEELPEVVCQIEPAMNVALVAGRIADNPAAVNNGDEILKAAAERLKEVVQDPKTKYVQVPVDDEAAYRWFFANKPEGVEDKVWAGLTLRVRELKENAYGTMFERAKKVLAGFSPEEFKESFEGDNFWNFMATPEGAAMVALVVPKGGFALYLTSLKERCSGNIPDYYKKVQLLLSGLIREEAHQKCVDWEEKMTSICLSLFEDNGQDFNNIFITLAPSEDFQKVMANMEAVLEHVAYQKNPEFQTQEYCRFNFLSGIKEAFDVLIPAEAVNRRNSIRVTNRTLVENSDSIWKCLDSLSSESVEILFKEDYAKWDDKKKNLLKTRLQSTDNHRHLIDTWE